MFLRYPFKISQRPRQHQSQYRDDQSNVQKQIATRHPAGEHELQDQVGDDEQQSQQGQESLAVREKIREYVN